ncbi:hypothetical protein ASPWEDRAFT_43558 [Aspergillus wentii DTO 134E9]|uniref:Luciferase domain-containing protein n=1 Tax=Aspergillus wentii DTO 134E9 TaxID=1073089 RepID=A0A1L9RF18_ASPWE|nr:uncharacterized protein ASPWEDRAFT_43558 [Aspergillus wentii DTO 134E9]OJJ33510.1 hypothetical protein ASPWEDRAFT_43558 [Aspergillus wentii DTO 134E9]
MSSIIKTGMDRSSHAINRFFEKAYAIDIHNLKQNSPLLVSGALVLGGAVWAVNDYRDWVAFGTGGTPPTPRGYLKVTLLRVANFFRYILGDDLRDASSLPRGGPKYLQSLPMRKGGHPALKPRALPQRQEPEYIPSIVKEKLFNLINDHASKDPDTFNIALSRTEGGTADAIYLNPDLLASNSDAKGLGGEIAHVHPSECSLHLLLSAEDARTVLEANWGKRFPIYWITPPGWIMLYAPRNEEELELVSRVVDAAVQFAKGTSSQ